MFYSRKYSIWDLKLVNYKSWSLITHFFPNNIDLTYKKYNLVALINSRFNMANFLNSLICISKMHF